MEMHPLHARGALVKSSVWPMPSLKLANFVEASGSNGRFAAAHNNCLA